MNDGDLRQTIDTLRKQKEVLERRCEQHLAAKVAAEKLTTEYREKYAAALLLLSEQCCIHCNRRFQEFAKNEKGATNNA